MLFNVLLHCSVVLQCTTIDTVTRTSTRYSYGPLLVLVVALLLTCTCTYNTPTKLSCTDSLPIIHPTSETTWRHVFNGWCLPSIKYVNTYFIVPVWRLSGHESIRFIAFMNLRVSYFLSFNGLVTPRLPFLWARLYLYFVDREHRSRTWRQIYIISGGEYFQWRWVLLPTPRTLTQNLHPQLRSQIINLSLAISRDKLTMAQFRPSWPGMRIQGAESPHIHLISCFDNNNVTWSVGLVILCVPVILSSLGLAHAFLCCFWTHRFFVVTRSCSSSHTNLVSCPS